MLRGACAARLPDIHRGRVVNNSLRNASINVKVALAPALALAGLVIVAILGWTSNRGLASEMSAIGGAGLQRVVDAQALSTHITKLHQNIYQSLTWEAIGIRAELIKALDDSLLVQLKALEKSADGSMHSVTDEGRAIRDDLKKVLGKYAVGAASTLDIKGGGLATAGSYVGSLEDDYQTIQKLVDGFVDLQQRTTQATVLAAEASARRQSAVMASVAGALLLLCGGLAWAFARAIATPLAHAASAAGQLAQGDLTARQSDTGSDATGRVLAALDEVARNLTGLVGDIRHTADQINTASGEIASGNADLSARTESTASSLQQAAGSIEQLAATIRNSADSAREASKLASEASAVARQGGTLVSDVVRTMDAINGQAKKIADIIGVIDGIAFQTNILALNAAVEAARAGEQGRGFAVVAGEVRTLARRSGEAAREIRALISSSVEQIESGASRAQAAGKTMGQIVGSIEQVADTVAGISRATAEQAVGIDQVNQSVAEMDRSTQQNASMVEQASAATESLNLQAQNLVQLLTRFKTAA